MGTSGTNDCQSYPYTLSAFPAYGDPRTIVTLDLLGGQTTFRQIFTGSYRALLQGYKSKINEVFTRAQMCLGTIPNATDLVNGIDNVCAVLDAQTNLQNLLELPQGNWPSGVFGRLRDLYDAGLYVNSWMIPDTDKSAVALYFDSNGDGFLEKAGDLTLQNYFELPRNTYSQAVLDLLYRGRRLGVLLCHASAALTSKNYCWNGITCVITTQNKACSGNASSSDPC